MKAQHHKPVIRWLKGGGIAAASLAVGIVLLYASFAIVPETTASAGTRLAAATSPATGPSDTPPSDQPSPGNRSGVAQSMSSMLLLLGMMAVAVGLIAAGWVVYDIRHSRPKWMTQTKYPVRR